MVSQMKPRKAQVAPVIGAIALVAVAAVVTAGIAGAVVKVKKTTITLAADGDQQFVTAKCKKGLRAVSGGFEAPGFVTEGGGNVPYQIILTSQRESKRKWTESAVDDAGGGDFVNFVKCSNELPKLKTKSATVTVPDGEVGTATAHCPKNGEAVSGGFVPAIDSAPQADFIFITESRRAGKRDWQVTGYNNHNDPLELTTFAYCAKHKVGLKTKSATDETTTDEADIVAKAKCKKGQRAVSGGFSASLVVENPPTVDVFTQPFESRPAGRRAWKGAGGAYPDPGLTAAWTTFAYCLG
jgi:hypothetical protein